MENEQEQESSEQREASGRRGQLAILRYELAQSARWCVRAVTRCLRWLRELCLAAWRHERSVRAREALLRGAHAVRRHGVARLLGARRAVRHVVRVSGLVVIIALMTLGVGRFTLRLIEAGEVGVRYSKWSGEGVLMRDFGPGLQLSLPGVHKWHSLPSGTELLTWRSVSPEDPGTSLDVRTLDGTSITLDLCVPYQIQKGQAHLVVAEGHRNTYREQARSKIQQVLLDEFGRLRTEEFSRSGVRRNLLELALSRLNTSLAEIHVVAEEILVDEVRFSPAYEKKLVETQRERQRGRVLEARQFEDQEHQTILRRRSEIDQELLALRIERDQEIELLRAQGQTQAVEESRAVAEYESDQRADADREYALLVAQGEAAVLRAQELERRLHGEILIGVGGKQYLALQAARATRIEEVVLDANDPRVPNPLDVASMVGLFLGEE